MAPAVSTLASPTPSGASIQQPLAATIPPELLMQIFDEVHELMGEDAVSPASSIKHKQQTERLRQSLVCRSWFAARIGRNDYYAASAWRVATLTAALGADPVRAAAADKLILNGGGQIWPKILALCINATEVSLTSNATVAADALSSLPASLRTLKLNLSGSTFDHSLPELTPVPQEAKVEVSFVWGNFHISFTDEVLRLLSPVLAQITHLDLDDNGLGLGFQDDPYVFNILPKLTALKQLVARPWQLNADQLVEQIAAATALERLHLAYCDDDYHNRPITPSFVAEIIENAQPTLKLIKMHESIMEYRDDVLWTAAAIAELKKTAKERGIRFTIQRYEFNPIFANDRGPINDHGYDSN